MNQIKLHHAAANARPVEASAGYIAEELQHYEEHLRDAQGLTAGTRSQNSSLPGG